MVVYSGNSSARQVLLDHELWLNPSSMDVKMNVSAGILPGLGAVLSQGMDAGMSLTAGLGGGYTRFNSASCLMRVRTKEMPIEV
eukprot:scaffold84624_cov20-Tisochrysis_lutea.AAC.1